MEESTSTAKVARAFGKAYGLLNAVKSLTQAEMFNARIRPMYSFAKIHNTRVTKLSQEKADMLAEIMADIPEDFGARPLTLAEQAEWEIGWFQWQKGGRPALSGSPMTPRQIRVDDKLWEAVKKKAEEEEKNVSEIVREALAQYCK